MDSLAVDLNRTGTHSIDVAPAIRIDGPFEVVLDNSGASLHVFLQLDDDLAEAATLSAGNHFVEEGRIRGVAVDVDTSMAPVRGRLKIVTGYGTETEFVTVAVDEREPDEGSVVVDESLSTPRPRPTDEDSGPNVGLDLQGVPLYVLGALAVVVAVLATIALEGSLSVLVTLVVLVAVGIGVALLRG